ILFKFRLCYNKLVVSEYNLAWGIQRFVRKEGVRIQETETRIKSCRVLHIAYIVTRLSRLPVNQLILKPSNW
ncbi:unnamed protein product, partial [marine sediment metagenome]